MKTAVFLLAKKGLGVDLRKDRFVHAAATVLVAATLVGQLGCGVLVEGAAGFETDGAAIVGHGDANRPDAVVLDELAQGASGNDSHNYG